MQKSKYHFSSWFSFGYGMRLTGAAKGLAKEHQLKVRLP